jgi:hypothetical protein
MDSGLGEKYRYDEINPPDRINPEKLLRRKVGG